MNNFKPIVSINQNGSILIINPKGQYTLETSHVKYEELLDLLRSGNQETLEQAVSNVDEWINMNMRINGQGEVVVVKNNQVFTASVNHPKYSELVSAIETKNYGQMQQFIDSVESWINLKKISFTQTLNTITLTEDGEGITIIGRSDKRFAKISEALDKKDMETVKNLITPEKAVEFMGDENFKMVDGTMLYKDEPVPEAVSKRVKDMAKQGMDLTPILKFWEKLSKNPSYNSRGQLFEFLQANNIAIKEDGNFVAYKKVTHDYKDIHTKTIDNSIGQTIKLDRTKVDDNPNNTCSSGLHICSFDYLPHFGQNTDGENADKVLLCSVSPEHMVSVPTDYKNSKARVCEYTVIGELEMPKPMNKLVYEHDNQFSSENDPMANVVDEETMNDDISDDEDDLFSQQYGYSSDDRDNVINYYNAYCEKYKGEALITRIEEALDDDGESIDEETIEQILVDAGHWDITPSSKNEDNN